MSIKLITNDAQHKSALQQIEKLWHAATGSAKADKRDVLCVLVNAYEEQHHPIAPPDPIEYLKFIMDQRGWLPKDLGEAAGLDKNRVSEYLNRKRRLSIKAIRSLAAIDLPADVLIREYEIEV